MQLIHHLSATERQQAADWLASPVHNQRQELSRLFHLLCERVHTLGVSISREETFAKLFPGRPYDDQSLRLLCSYLLKSLEQWLAWRQWRQSGLEPSLHLLQAYRELGLEKHLRRHARRTGTELERSPLRHPEHYWRRFQLESEIYRWESREGRGRPFNLQEQEDALQTAFLSLKLRQACLTVAHQQVFAADYQLAMLAEVLDCSGRPPFDQIPAVAIYRHIYQMYATGATDEAFVAYRQVLFDAADQFPADEARDLLLFGINYCIRRINEGQRHFQREAFALYQKGLKEALLLRDGRLTPFTYNNIIGIALRLREIEWAEDFLSTYRSRLEARHREPIFALNAARIAYQRNDFRTALHHLHQADQRDFIHHMTAKTLQLKIFYESGDHQLLASHIKNVRAYLRRRRNPGYHEQVFNNIFSLTEQLLKLRPYDRAQRSALRQRIESTQPLTEKDWLLAQLA